jgi:hypothetical protein
MCADPHPFRETSAETANRGGCAVDKLDTSRKRHVYFGGLLDRSSSSFACELKVAPGTDVNH